MEAILILSLPAFLMYKCAKNYVKDNFIYMKILDKDRYAICMIKPNFYQQVLETVEVIKKNVKIRFCFFKNYSRTVIFRAKVSVTKPNIFIEQRIFPCLMFVSYVNKNSPMIRLFLNLYLK